MKIVHISTDDYAGGASIAAFRMHAAMLGVGMDSSMLVGKKNGEYDNVYLFEPGMCGTMVSRYLPKIKSRFKIAEYHKSRGLFSNTVIGNDVSRHFLVNQADIIFLHWINRGFLSLSGIEKILMLGKPVYWVLHDMWAMTGGCHHSFDCSKYITHCGTCPHLVKPSDRDPSYRLFENKLKVFDRFDNLRIITPSNWLGGRAKQSRLFSNKKISILPNYLDTALFKPVDKQGARDAFNLNKDKTIILFGAVQGVSNPYKGWPYLRESLRNIAKAKDNLELFIFGSDYTRQIADSVPFPVHFSGHIHDCGTLCMLYNAADVYVSPSLAETLGNTIAESLACGTPAAGFNVGGIPDLIEHKINGYLARYQDTDDLAEGILWILNNTADLKDNARNKILALTRNSLASIKQQFSA